MQAAVHKCNIFSTGVGKDSIINESKGSNNSVSVDRISIRLFAKFLLFCIAILISKFSNLKF